MIITKHVSLDHDCIQKIEPVVEKHKGNFSAAIREIINQAGRYTLSDLCAIDTSLFRWMLKEIENRLIPDNIIDEFIQPSLINSMEKLENFLNYKFSRLRWNINIALKYDNDSFPRHVVVYIKGPSQEIRLVAKIVSQYFVKNSNLEITSVINLDSCIKLELSSSGKRDSVVKFFGEMHEMMKSIRSNPIFWRCLVKMHVLNNYNMVTLHRNYFEDILAGKIPVEITIENLAKRAIQEIPLKELLSLIKEVYEVSRIVDRVEIDNESIILYHNYRNKEAIEKLRKSVVLLLETSGHVYDARCTSNMIMLTHRPDVGIRINKIVDNLRTSKSSFDKELIMFVAFLKGLENIPDIALSLSSLGRRIGKSLMQEFEKENSIRTWNLHTFKKAIESIDSKFHRKSECRLEDNSMRYIIKRCCFAQGHFNYLCYTFRETFKGALSYAFGDSAQLEIKRLLSHGDDFCEVVIRIP